MTEQEMVARLAAQDATVLPEFYERYRSTIMAIAMPLVKDPWDAEEVLQDVVWAAFRKGHTFRGDSDFRWWLRRVTRNAALMLLLKRKRVPTPMEDQQVEHFLETSPRVNAPPSPEKALALERAAERMRQRFGELKPVNQELYNATDIQGQPMARVADTLGMTLPALKARLHRIRKTLREALSDEFTQNAIA